MMSHRFAAHTVLALSISILCALVFASGSLVARAQENTITFPVAELGNCESKEACKAYCNDSSHVSECIAFAVEHGLMKKEEAQVAKKFAQTLKTKGGPGGCNTPDSCKAYCENVSHIEECLSFAQASGHHDQNVEEGKKVAAFIKKGGTLPGGCTSRQSCEAYCSDFSHIEECTAFAEKAGLDIHEPDGKKVDIQQVKKVHELMQRGETPGGCKSRQECEAFCQNPENNEQCLAFAEKAGFMQKDEVDRARTLMQRGGPGGCKSREECEAFCRTPENQETCMAFAQEQGMVRPEQAQQMREMRNTFDQGAHGAPPQVGKCVREKIMGAMQGGGMPDQAAMEAAIKECMDTIVGPDKFGGKPPMGGEQGEGMGPEGFGNDQFGPDQSGQGDQFGPQGPQGMRGEKGMMMRGMMQQGMRGPQEGTSSPEQGQQFQNPEEMMKQFGGPQGPRRPMQPRPRGESGVQGPDDENGMPTDEHMMEGAAEGMKAMYVRMKGAPMNGKMDEMGGEFEKQFRDQYKQQYGQEFNKQMDGNMQNIMQGIRGVMNRQGQGMQGMEDGKMMPPPGTRAGMKPGEQGAPGKMGPPPGGKGGMMPGEGGMQNMMQNYGKMPGNDQMMQQGQYGMPNDRNGREMQGMPYGPMGPQQGGQYGPPQGGQYGMPPMGGMNNGQMPQGGMQGQYPPQGGTGQTMPPPQGGMPQGGQPPAGEGGTQPPPQQGAPPPTGGTQPPPPPPPTSMNPVTNMVANVLSALFALYGAH